MVPTWHATKLRFCFGHITESWDSGPDEGYCKGGVDCCSGTLASGLWRHPYQRAKRPKKNNNHIINRRNRVFGRDSKDGCLRYFTQRTAISGQRWEERPESEEEMVYKVLLLMAKGCHRTWIDGHERYVFPTHLKRPLAVNRPRLMAQSGRDDMNGDIRSSPPLRGSSRERSGQKMSQQLWKNFWRIEGFVVRLVPLVVSSLSPQASTRLSLRVRPFRVSSRLAISGTMNGSEVGSEVAIKFDNEKDENVVNEKVKKLKDNSKTTQRPDQSITTSECPQILRH